MHRVLYLFSDQRKQKQGHPMQARRYRIQNWAHYNRALIQRGSITVWVDEGSLGKWLSTSSSGKAGRPAVYSDDALLMLLMLRETFRLPLRALEGFAKSILRLMGVSFSVPSYTQISRRAQSLHKRVGRLSSRQARDLVFDSTGLKVYGEGEWKVKVHGKGKRRTWKKLHIAIDAHTQDIVMCELTDREEGDAEVGRRMLRRIPGKIRSVRADGGYDAGAFRREVDQKGGESIIPPPKHATYKGIKEGWERKRDATLAEIEGLGGGEEGRKLWKKLIGYHRRSLVETGMFRIKRTQGECLKARSEGGQKTEAICKCLVINKMNNLGLPRGSWESKAA